MYSTLFMVMVIFGILLRVAMAMQQNIEGVEGFLFYYCEFGLEELVEVEVKLESLQIHHYNTQCNTCKKSPNGDDVYLV